MLDRVVLSVTLVLFTISLWCFVLSGLLVNEEQDKAIANLTKQVQAANGVYRATPEGIPRNCIYYDGTWAAFMDPNKPKQFVWMKREEIPQ